MIGEILSSSQGLLAFVIALSVLVLVHELGHFAVAKAVGIRVESFSLFFGRPVFSVRKAQQGGWRVRFLNKTWGLSEEEFTHGETEYAIRWIPFGGYVKMTGQSDFGEAEGTEESWSFTAKPVWARTAVVFAGPFMNFVLAAMVFAVLNMTNGVIGRIGIAPQVIGQGSTMWAGSIEPGTFADSMNVAPGDRWAAINGSELSSWSVVDSIASNDSLITVTLVSVTGETRNITLRNGISDLYQIGIKWDIDPVVGFAIPLEPAAGIELSAGARVLSVDGIPVNTWEEMSELIRVRPGVSIPIQFQDETGEHSRHLTPSTEFAVDTPYDGLQLPLFSAITTSIGQTWDVVFKMVRFLESLVTGAISPKFVAGPIGIFQMTGAAAERGFASYIYFIAFLSAQLGFINLLPLAVLDGGHLVFFAFEAIAGRRPSARQQGMIQQVGMMLLLGLMVFVTFMDVQRLLGM